jgi:hypothetical protein
VGRYGSFSIHLIKPAEFGRQQRKTIKETGKEIRGFDLDLPLKPGSYPHI